MPDAIPFTPARFGSGGGQPLSRRDGALKVTGAATYAADNHPAGLLYAVAADATIARGRVRSLDVAAALAHPGVVHVMTPENRPGLSLDPDGKAHFFAFRTEALQNDRVRYAGQPIALVLAETLEAATEGARLLAPTYEAEPARVGLDGDAPFAPNAVGIGAATTTAVGDVAAGLAAASSRIEAVYETPDQYHNAMEPHSIVAAWDGDRLTIDSPNQAIGLSRGAFAAYFGVAPENVTLRSPFLGGGFGSKAIIYGAQLLTILAARELGRPVKFGLRRDQMFGPVGHRGATRQTLRIGANESGRITALDHFTRAVSSTFEDFFEPASNASLNLYAAPALRASHEGVRADKGTPGPVRAPGEASGSAALECAVDEAAAACGMDPLEFRLRNYAETDPATGRPYSSKALRECYRDAAAKFGWAGRPLAPRSMRDKDGFLIGWGMGSALFPAPMFMAEARATLRADGTGLVETSAADMGQGAWTVLAQIGAEALGIDVEKVELRAGSSDLPDAGIAGGSGHTATAGGAIHAAGSEAVAKLIELAAQQPASPLFGAGNARIVGRDGRLHLAEDENRGESYAEILARAGLDRLEGGGKCARNPEDAAARAMFTHGAVFAEVKVDPDLFQVRATRLVGAFAAGRIVNPKLARSQLLGGMVWGVSFALLEEAITDRRSGRIVNADLAGYHFAANADIPEMEALTVHEDDPFVNALGIKGVGEVGITGTVGAVANAVWHATGVRPRRFPIRIEDLLG